MKAIPRYLVLSTIFATLSACGGGGTSTSTNAPTSTDSSTSTDASTSTNASNKTELEGTWVYASEGHTTGSTCGGSSIEVRATLTFEGSTLRTVMEHCKYASEHIMQNDTGTFVQTSSSTLTVILGDVYMTHGSDVYKTIDFTRDGVTVTTYSGYSVSGNTLKFAALSPYPSTNDGNTPATRLRGTEGGLAQPTYIKQ